MRRNSKESDTIFSSKKLSTKGLQCGAKFKKKFVDILLLMLSPSNLYISIKGIILVQLINHAPKLTIILCYGLVALTMTKYLLIYLKTREALFSKEYIARAVSWISLPVA